MRDVPVADRPPAPTRAATEADGGPERPADQPDGSSGPVSRRFLPRSSRSRAV